VNPVHQFFAEAQGQGWRVWSHVHDTHKGEVLQMILSSPRCNHCGDGHTIQAAVSARIDRNGWNDAIAALRNAVASHTFIGCRQ
jgi:hypothetical protein